MAEDKKTISHEAGIPTEAPEQPSPVPDLADTAAPAPQGPEALTVEEQLILEHEGQAALFEMGEAIPDAPEFPGVTIPEQPEPDKPEQQASTPGKVVDFAAAREETGKATPPAKEVDPPDKEHKKPEQPRRGRPSKADKAAPSKADPAKKDKATPTKAEKPKRDKMSQSKAPPPRRRPPLLPSQSSPPSPVTLPEPKKRRSYISIFRSCTHSKTTPLASVTMRKCRGWWSLSRRLALISLRWCVPVRAAAMRSSPDTAASGPASWPDFPICPVSSAK